MANPSINLIREKIVKKKVLQPSEKIYLDTLLIDASTNTLANTTIALTDEASIDLTAMKHTLTSDAATITFTISYTGDDITLELTLNATDAVYTFPTTALCIAEGTASGDNTLTLSGVSGDKYIIGIKNVGGNYYVASKNFGQ